jgi:hypothetical protein
MTRDFDVRHHRPKARDDPGVDRLRQDDEAVASGREMLLDLGQFTGFGEGPAFRILEAGVEGAPEPQDSSR